MTKHVQNLSAKIDKFLAPLSDDVLFFIATAVSAMLAQSLGLLP